MTPAGNGQRISISTAVEELEEAQCVFVFLFRSLIENPGDLDIIFLPGPAGEKIITGSGLGLGGKGDKQVFGRSAVTKRHWLFPVS